MFLLDKQQVVGYDIPTTLIESSTQRSVAFTYQPYLRVLVPKLTAKVISGWGRVHTLNLIK